MLKPDWPKPTSSSAAAGHRRVRRHGEAGDHRQVQRQPAEIEPRIPGRPGECRHQQRAGEGADAIHAGEDAGRLRPEAVAVLRHHRHQAGEGPAEDVEEDGHHQRAAQPRASGGPPAAPPPSAPARPPRSRPPAGCGSAASPRRTARAGRARRRRRSCPRCPTAAKSRPEMVGPSMRLALLLPTSKDIACPMRAGPTTWPISIRRTGLSAAQAMPLTKLASARCQTASMPRHGQRREARPRSAG